MGRQKIPCRPTTFCERHRGFASFSVRIVNTHAKVRARVVKVPCFTVKFGLPAGPAPERDPYRGFDHLGRWVSRSGQPAVRRAGKTRHFRNDLRVFSWESVDFFRAPCLVCERERRLRAQVRIFSWQSDGFASRLGLVCGRERHLSAQNRILSW